MRPKLGAHSEYKPSGIAWFGQVPAHWDIRRTKFVFRYYKELNTDRAERNVLSLTLRGVVNNDLDNPEGLVPQDYASYQVFEKHDLVFKLIDLENLRTSRVGLVHERGIMSSAYVRLKQRTPGSIRFFYYQFFDLYLRGIFNQLGGGVRATLGPRDLLDLPILLPPREEQDSIARFLDAKEAEISRLIAAKLRLVALLDEQRQSIVRRAVTRGIDERARNRQTNVEWLGEVPEHWDVKRVKNVTQVLRGKFTHRPRNDPALYGGPYPFIQTGDVARADKTITTHSQTLNDAGLAVSQMFPRGTLAMTIAANIGDVAILDFDACFPDSVVGFVPRSTIDRDYLYYVFRSMKTELLREAPVNTQGNLNIDRISARGVPVPPHPEQLRIVQFIEENTADIDAAIANARQEIDLIREYRVRLLLAVIGGELDVRDAASHLSEHEAALESADGLLADSGLVDEAELEEVGEEISA
jgi:type I restriction enzyme S subunit